MHWLSTSATMTATAAIVAGMSCTSPAEASPKVGDAMAVEHNVSGSLPGQTRKVVKGDDVFEQELIRTAAASTAEIFLIDKTLLVIGPTAAVKLDWVEFNADQSFKTLMLNARNGALRWTSGTSPSSAYQITTPSAVIRVNGTTFDLLVQPQQTTVVLQEGAVEVCTTSKPQRCKTMSR